MVKQERKKERRKDDYNIQCVLTGGLKLKRKRKLSKIKSKLKE